MLPKPSVLNVQSRSFPTMGVIHRDKAKQNESSHLRIGNRRVLSVSNVEINGASEISADVGRYVVSRRALDYVNHEHVLFGRVEDWRVDCRVRWLFRRFHFGPQSGSLITFPVPALRTGRAVFPHLGSPVGSCVSHTGPRSHPWTTPMGLAPVPYSIHVRSRSAARPVDALTTPSSSDDPFTFACDASGVSGPFTGVSGFRHSRDPSPFGHRSSPEAPSLHRHYPASPVLRASPPPCRPSLPLTGSRFGACLTTHRASHVATFFPFHACQRHYPGGSKGVPASLASPSVFGLPHFSGGSAPALSVSRPARRSLAFRPACSLNRLMRPFDTRVLQTISLPP